MKEFGIVCAKYLIWLVPASLLVAWLCGKAATRQRVLQAALAAVLGLLLNKLISLFWYHPRPFVIGLGHTFMQHAPTSSFPSNHLTALFSISFTLLLSPQLRRLGVILTLLGVLIAWARIYVGVHYPLDMLGSAVVAALCSVVLFYMRASLVQPLFNLIDPLYVRLCPWRIQHRA